MDIKVKRVNKELSLPVTDKDASCFDLICRRDEVIKPKEVKLVPLNIMIEVPNGYALLLFVRSSTPLRKGLMLANSVGIVDPFYRGNKDEVLCELYNFTDNDVEIKSGEKLVQGMIIKHEQINWREVEDMDEEGTGYWRPPLENE